MGTIRFSRPAAALAGVWGVQTWRVRKLMKLHPAADEQTIHALAIAPDPERPKRVTPEKLSQRWLASSL